MRKLLIAVLVLGIAAAVGFQIWRARSHPYTPQLSNLPVVHPGLTENQRSSIKTLEEKGVIKIEASRHRVQVVIDVWASMDASEKENFIGKMGMACAERNESDDRDVELIDMQSAQTLATWKSGQFKVY